MLPEASFQPLGGKALSCAALRASLAGAVAVPPSLALPYGHLRARAGGGGQRVFQMKVFHHRHDAPQTLAPLSVRSLVRASRSATPRCWLRAHAARVCI
jgi:hypothetical protein